LDDRRGSLPAKTVSLISKGSLSENVEEEKPRRTGADSGSSRKRPFKRR